MPQPGRRIGAGGGATDALESRDRAGLLDVHIDTGSPIDTGNMEPTSCGRKSGRQRAMVSVLTPSRVVLFYVLTMVDFARLVDAMRANPAQVRFRDAVKVATHYFGEPRQRGTSHCVWKMPWPGDPRANLQSSQGGMAKIYQVKQLLAAIERLGSSADEG